MDNPMNVLAIVGSVRKGKATDILVDKAIEGVTSGHLNCFVKKVNLIDYRIGYCRNCLTCRDSETKEPVAKCQIRDDMDFLNEDLLKSDSLILGTPVHMGFATAIMMTFLERICWTFAKPEKNILTLSGCPLPRSDKKRKAVIIVTSGIVPPIYRIFCDKATPLIRGTIRDSLNAKTIDSMYAGDIEHRGAEYYFDKAFNLGKKLV
ncbi:MAG: flavodoxin family protein [Deltaproteobacteria bacterium]|nr:flavodoxin family protein [Deltaproteobacteria bacterium]